MKTLIIAEAGVNHNGDLALARRLVDAAAAAGADIVKFQTFRAAHLATAYAARAAYQRTADDDQTQYQMLKGLELSYEMHEALIAHCRSCGIGFLSTAFDTASVDMLVSLGIECFKIPSGEITNLPYLRHIGRLGKRVILSTGMATLDETAAALDVLTEAGVRHGDITVLHCCTEYPAPLNHVNLRAMLTLRDRFGTAVGYSDHTLGIEVAVAAVALGASVIEKHFTLDKTLPGPDHKASLGVDELKAMVTAIRNVELARGDGLKYPSPGEISNMKVARKSLVALRAIARGEVFSAANLGAKRPGTGLSPMRWDEVLGSRAPRDFAPDELIELESEE